MAIGGFIFSSGMRAMVRVTKVQELNHTSKTLFLRGFSTDEKRIKTTLSLYEFFRHFTAQSDGTIESCVRKVFSQQDFHAFGLPLGRFDPLGADRIVTTEQTWKVDVSKFISKAETLVVSLTDAPGTQWEIGEIIRLNRLDHTIFTYAEDSDDLGEKSILVTLEALTKIDQRIGNILEKLHKDRKCFSLYFCDGEPTVFYAKELRANGYIAVFWNAKQHLSNSDASV
jgi:hypothetical protein